MMQSRPAGASVDASAGGVRTVVDELRFPESLRWHDGRIWVVDLVTEKVLSYDRDGAASVTHAVVPGMPGGLGFLPDGTPLFASMQGRTLNVADAQGAVSVYADLAEIPVRGGGAPAAPAALNDMVVDRAGRAYVGYRSPFPKFRDGARYEDYAAEVRDEGVALVTPDGVAVVAASGLRGTNGMAVDEAGRLYVAESFAGQINRYKIAADGSLHDREIWADLSGVGFPDGICIDAQGAIWAAIRGSLATMPSSFVRFVDGRAEQAIEVESGRAITCALGGSEGRTLYMAITISSMADTNVMINPQTRSQSEALGRIDAVEVRVPGI
jgi:sugar lactone lactonase YvrE